MKQIAAMSPCYPDLHYCHVWWSCCRSRCWSDLQRIP
jgi:hypothetical protein